MSDSEYYVVDGWGDSLDSPSVEEMRKFLDKLDIDDPEHCEVWLSHALLDRTLSCRPNNEVVFEDDTFDGQSASRHLTNVSRHKMLMLWQKLANGDIAELDKEPWLLGSTSEIPPPKLDLKDIFGDYWKELSAAERIPNARCKNEECSQNPITQTVFCPKHFFEKCTKIPCPFE